MSTPAAAHRFPPPEGAESLNLRPILDVVKRINSERNLRRLVTMILDTAIEFSNATRGTLAIFKDTSFNAELSRHRSRGEIKHDEIASLAPALNRVRTTGTGGGLTWITSDPHDTGEITFKASDLTRTQRRSTPFGQPLRPNQAIPQVRDLEFITRLEPAHDGRSPVDPGPVEAPEVADHHHPRLRRQAAMAARDPQRIDADVATVMATDHQRSLIHLNVRTLIQS
jgi:hypothetical protein